MTNPYQPPTTSKLTNTHFLSRVRVILAALVLLAGLGIAVSGIVRFNRYGGVESLKTFSPTEMSGAALWALTHLVAVLSVLGVSWGICTQRGRVVVLGSLLFCAVCAFA